MSSTNKTTNYELSQFLGTDKPAWINDYNADMGKIDSGIHNAQTTATGADGKADANTTAIGTLASLTTDAKTSLVAAINEVDSHADTAQSTANTANNNAGTAIGKANDALANFEKFNLSTEIPLTVTTSAGSVAQNTLKIRKDSSNSVFKIYGQLFISGLSGVTGAVTLTVTTNSGLNPSSAYDIECASTVYIGKTDGSMSTGGRKITINADGTITIPAETGGGNTTYISYIFPPCLYFNTDFGD